jgi:dihydroxyacetone kinase
MTRKGRRERRDSVMATVTFKNIEGFSHAKKESLRCRV